MAAYDRGNPRPRGRKTILLSLAGTHMGKNRSHSQLQLPSQSAFFVSRLVRPDLILLGEAGVMIVIENNWQSNLLIGSSSTVNGNCHETTLMPRIVPDDDKRDPALHTLKWQLS